MRIEAERPVADMAGDHAALLRPDHPHGDVGLALEQVVDAVTGHQLDLDLRMSLREPDQDRRQNMHADDLARGQTD